MSTRQWKRRVRLIIGKAGNGLLVEHLRVAFEVKKTLESDPNTATIKIWNLNPDNEAKARNEYDEVLLEAGYEGAMRLVFRGNIQHVYRYRDGQDFITEIEAGDGDKSYRNATMNETLAAGTDNALLANRAASSMRGEGTEPAEDIEALFAKVAEQTDIDLAEGVNLDVLGDIVGIGRIVPDSLALPFFGFDGQAGAGNFGEEDISDIGKPFFEEGEPGAKGFGEENTPSFGGLFAQEF